MWCKNFNLTLYRICLNHTLQVYGFPHWKIQMYLIRPPLSEKPWTDALKLNTFHVYASTHVYLSCPFVNIFCCVLHKHEVLRSMVRWCLFKWILRENNFCIFHAYKGFSPEWVKRCLFRLPFWENPLLHKSQAWGFSPVCVRRCSIEWTFWENPLLHTSQT